METPFRWVSCAPDCQQWVARLGNHFAGRMVRDYVRVWEVHTHGAPFVKSFAHSNGIFAVKARSTHQNVKVFPVSGVITLRPILLLRRRQSAGQ
jgi:hypothetical protein